MCVVALSFENHPQWRLVLAGNRDEFHERPAEPLHRWQAAPYVIAGRDVQAGGGWLGVSEQGRLAVVTNIRNPDGPDASKASRGALVGNWLIEGSVPRQENLSGYNPFNLLLLDGAGMMLHSNLPAPQRLPLGPGIHGLSNGHPGEPWPRQSAAEMALARTIEGGGGVDALLDMLRDESIADDAGAPIFIRAPIYGTRCSTVVLIDHGGNGSITERSFRPDGGVTGEVHIDFRWPL